MTRMARKTAQPLSDVLKDFIKANRLTRGINIQCVFRAWDDASGAAAYTSRRFFRDGKLYITLSSSVVRSQLSFQKDLLLEKVNARLSEDRLFDADDESGTFVKELILK